VDYAPKDRKQLWKAAIKLPMYSVGVVPVLVSSPAAAAAATGRARLSGCCHLIDHSPAGSSRFDSYQLLTVGWRGSSLFGSQHHALG
jgi:hypothetical protein